jgi:acylphosphatase
MNDLVSIQALVYGRVQGVFFRDFVFKRATNLDLTGYVRNLPNGEAVEVIAEGERQGVEKLVGFIKVGPPSASVVNVVTNWLEYSGNYSGFSIRY